MIVLLRFIGVMNAAVWFGAAVCFTFAVAPAFAAPDMQKLFGEVYAGIAGLMVAERYYVLQYWCGAVALMHALAEWVYLGRALQRLTFGLLIGLFSVGLVSGLWLHPRLKRLHELKYARPELVPPAQRAQAGRSFAIWHGVYRVVNVFVLGGLVIYTWRVANPGDGSRFVPSSKFRS